MRAKTQGAPVTTLYESETVHLSVIIPAYNERERLVPYMTEITGYLARRAKPYEVLVVDDGSHDGTAALVEQFRTKEPAVRLLRLAQNTGKGCAVRTGMQVARGEFQLMADADGDPYSGTGALGSCHRHWRGHRDRLPFPGIARSPVHRQSPVAPKRAREYVQLDRAAAGDSRD